MLQSWTGFWLKLSGEHPTYFNTPCLSWVLPHNASCHIWACCSSCCFAHMRQQSYACLHAACHVMPGISRQLV